MFGLPVFGGFGSRIVAPLVNVCVWACAGAARVMAHSIENIDARNHAADIFALAAEIAGWRSIRTVTLLLRLLPLSAWMRTSNPGLSGAPQRVGRFRKRQICLAATRWTRIPGSTRA